MHNFLQGCWFSKLNATTKNNQTKKLKTKTNTKVIKTNTKSKSTSSIRKKFAKNYYINLEY